MKLGSTLLTIAFAVLALSIVVWIGRPAPETGPQPVQIKSPPPDEFAPEGAKEEDRPEISSTGPYPKVVIPDGLEFDFDAMAFGDEKTHAFVIRNEGEAPLKLAKGGTTCQCTLSELAANEIPPGGEASIELKWKPTAPTDSFRKGPTIFTNYPEQKEFFLAVVGRVVNQVKLFPGQNWQLGFVSNEQPAEFTGSISSPVLDEFQILGLETKAEGLTFEQRTLTDEELKELGSKVGYSIKAIIAPSNKIGMFRHDFTINTTINQEKEGAVGSTFPVFVEGTRSGPIRFAPTFGVSFDADSMRLSLQRFQASEGKVGKLQLFVSDFPETLTIEPVIVDPEQLKVSLSEPQALGEGRARYELILEMPPGAPPMVRNLENKGRLLLKSNHPEVEEIDLTVTFVSQ